MKIIRSCHEVHRLVAESMDRPLPLWERVVVRLHLSVCEACTNFKRQMRWLRFGMRHVDD